MPDPQPVQAAVRLRQFTSEDVPMLLDLATDAYVPLTGTLPAHADRAEALEYIERQHQRLLAGEGFSFCVALAESDTAVGQAGLWLRSIDAGRATAGYAIAPRFRRKGFAGQALMAVTDFAWSLPEVHRIELYIEPWNEASRKTALKAGYELEGQLRSHQKIGAQRVDMMLYATTRLRLEAS